jgi:hypothetical protein
VAVNTPFEHRMLEIAREIEFFGDMKLVLNVLNVLVDSFHEEYDAAIRGSPKILKTKT